MKKHFKKSLAILLVATSFTFLYTTLETSNVLTYANTEVESEVKSKTEQKQDSEETTVESDTEQDAEETTAKDNTEQSPEKTAIESENEQRHDIEIVISEFFPSKKFVHYKDTLFNFDASLEDAYNHSKEELDKIYKDAKDKIKSTLDLDYPDDLEVPIYVHDLTNKDYAGQFCWSYIEIHPDHLPNEQTLPHEMTHALVSYILEEHSKNFNLGINEGIASQNNDWLTLDKLPEKYECFVDNYPTVKEERRIYYALHQYIIHDWIEKKGKDVVKKYLEEVKAGKDSVQAFLNLGGNDILKKYNCTIKKPKPPKKTRKIYVE